MTESKSLLHVDRLALPAFLAAHPQVQVGAEVGENFRFAAGFSGDKTGLVRFAMRLAIELSLPLAQNLWRAKLAALAKEHGAAGLSSVLLRRHGRFAATEVEGWAREFFPPTSYHPDQTLLHLFCNDKNIFAGVASARTCGSPFPGGVFSPRSASPSRASGKIEEAMAWFSAFRGISLSGRRWLELGAFPGGMTSVLLRDASCVTAVDLRERPKHFSGQTKLDWLQTDIEKFAAETPAWCEKIAFEKFDGLVSDLNGPAIPAALSVAKIVPRLAPGAVIFHTIKISHWADLVTTAGAVEKILRDAGMTHLTLRHFGRNRRELTLFGTCC